MRISATTAFTAAAAALFAVSVTGCSQGSDNAESATNARAAEAAQTESPSASPTSSPSMSPASQIKAVDTAGLGKILVDGKGNTLYLFEKDKTKKSTCTGACATQWPPAKVTATPKASGTDVQTNMLGTTKRDDGSMQATYNNHPLYYFAQDKKPGDVNGQGLNAFGAKWFVLDGAGAAVTKSPGSSSASPSGSPTGSPTGGSPGY